MEPISDTGKFLFLLCWSLLTVVTDHTESTHVAVTLRLLRLLVKYGHLPAANSNPESPLRSSKSSEIGAFKVPKFPSTIGATLAHSFSNTPPSVWIPIIPQLFARLGHPESVVRNRLVELISQIGVIVPQRIVYPTVGIAYIFITPVPTLMLPYSWLR